MMRRNCQPLPSSLHLLTSKYISYLKGHLGNVVFTICGIMLFVMKHVFMLKKCHSQGYESLLINLYSA